MRWEVKSASGMARAVIHNSDYASVADAQAAITRYLNDRNSSFAIAPRRAGKRFGDRSECRPRSR